MSTMATTNPPKFNFPGPVGTKRRRMRSGGNVSTISNNAPPLAAYSLEEAMLPEEDEDVVALADSDDVDEKVVQTSKCKGATTIPIFLKKTYKMIDTCDPSIASWTDEGDMFVVKDPEVFAARVIPQYFDHNKFSSFARQLNFYGFRKMQSKPIRNSDFDASSAKHVTFFNENFKRGRCDLLKKIQRSTRGTNTTTGQDQVREVQVLRDQISNLESKIQEMTVSTEERFRRLELDMLARIEQVMMAMQQQQQAQLRLQSAATLSTNIPSGASAASVASVQQQQQNWESLQPLIHRNNSLVSSPAGAQSSLNNFPPQPQRRPIAQVNSHGSNTTAMTAGPTLPPHPKQKQLPFGGLPGVMAAPPDRLTSLRGISALSFGLSGLPRGTSVESSASAVLLRNSWEDKFLSMFLLDENGNTNPAAAALMAGGGDHLTTPTPLAHSGHLMGLSGINPNGVAPSMISDQASTELIQHQHRNSEPNPADDLSSVSSSDIP